MKKNLVVVVVVLSSWAFAAAAEATDDSEYTFAPIPAASDFPEVSIRPYYNATDVSPSAVLDDNDDEEKQKGASPASITPSTYVPTYPYDLVSSDAGADDDSSADDLLPDHSTVAAPDPDAKPAADEQSQHAANSESHQNSNPSSITRTDVFADGRTVNIPAIDTPDGVAVLDSASEHIPDVVSLGSPIAPAVSSSHARADSRADHRADDQGTLASTDALADHDNPTIQPKITLLPANLTMELDKPAEATETIYLINLSEQTLDRQCLVRVNTIESVPDYQITISTRTEGDVIVASRENGEDLPGRTITLSNAVGERDLEATLWVSSSNVAPRATPYRLRFVAFENENVSGHDDALCPSSVNPGVGGQEIVLTLHVQAKASPYHTIVINTSKPVLGSTYDGIQVYARDNEGNPVTNEPLESFQVRLTKTKFLGVTCQVSLPVVLPGLDPYYPVSCPMPSVDDAGAWHLDVELQGEPVSMVTPNLTVLCPETNFETKTFECTSCLEWSGLQCAIPGLTLQTLDVARNKWRASAETTKIYECEYDGACVGGEPVMNKRNETTGFLAYASYLCADYHGGPLCQVCTHHSRYDPQKHRCVKCSKGTKDTQRFALVIASLVIAIVAIGRIILYCAIKYGDSSELSQFVADSVRSGSGGTYKAIRRRQLREQSSQRQLEQQSSQRHLQLNVGDESSLSPKDSTNNKTSQMMTRLRVSFLNKLKIMIAFFQILSSLPWVLNQIRYPRVFLSAASAFSLLDVHLVRITALECVVKKWNFYKVLYTSTIIPLILTALLVFYTLARIGMKWRCEIMSKQARMIFNKAIFLWLLMTFLIFPSISTTCFQFFSCEKFRTDLDGRTNLKVLQVDYSISCDSPSYKATEVYAIIALFVYPVGIPCIYFCLLWRHRTSINPELQKVDLFAHLTLSDEDKAFVLTAKRELGFVKQMIKVQQRSRDKEIEHLSFLWEEYEPRAYMFSVFECVRKLALSGILVFLYPGSSTQIAFGALFSLVSAKVYSHSKPFVEDEDDLIAEVAQEQLVLIFFLSLMLHVSNVCDDDDDQTNHATRVFAGPVFSAIFIMLMGGFVLLAIAIIILEIFGLDSLSDYLLASLSSKGAATPNKRNIIRSVADSLGSRPSDMSTSFSPSTTITTTQTLDGTPQQQHLGDVRVNIPDSGGSQRAVSFELPDDETKEGPVQKGELGDDDLVSVSRSSLDHAETPIEQSRDDDAIRFDDDDQESVVLEINSAMSPRSSLGEDDNWDMGCCAAPRHPQSPNVYSVWSSSSRHDT
ncbi:hypothetical protein CTAYLR_004144 [Chrysophaeum taylorii]|uniref:Uncharacterized protein n=1 Tax=Chrysophaeum taylorii TaxID=2483200 RepID=A0AAD7UNB0_9STRA|nr:hypothetical protein CTAYLR_004144 [Chrysophaeum taylorii]